MRATLAQHEALQMWLDGTGPFGVYFMRVTCHCHKTLIWACQPKPRFQDSACVYVSLVLGVLIALFKCPNKFLFDCCEAQPGFAQRNMPDYNHTR